MKPYLCLALWAFFQFLTTLCAILRGDIEASAP